LTLQTSYQSLPDFVAEVHQGFFTSLAADALLRIVELYAFLHPLYHANVYIKKPIYAPLQRVVTEWIPNLALAAWCAGRGPDGFATKGAKELGVTIDNVTDTAHRF
jgi:hypothetical protein